MMFAPTKIMPMATTRLYSWPAKFRMALDLVIPEEEGRAGGDAQRRDARELRRAPHGPRVPRPPRRAARRRRATARTPRRCRSPRRIPELLEMEQKHGSLVRGFLAQRKKVEEMRKKYPPKPGAEARARSSARSCRACSTSPTKLADAAGREQHPHRRGGDRARALPRTARGASRSTPARCSTGDAVIVASEAWAAEALVCARIDARDRRAVWRRSRAPLRRRS